MIAREEGFQQERGRDLVNMFLTREAGELLGLAAGGAVENLMCFQCGETLVEEMDRQFRMGCFEVFLKGLQEGAGFGGLPAGSAIGIQRVADDHDLYFVLADKSGDGLQIGAQVGLWCGAMQGKEWLRKDSQGIGNGQTDTPVSDVKRESTWMGHCVSVAM